MHLPTILKKQYLLLVVPILFLTIGIASASILSIVVIPQVSQVTSLINLQSLIITSVTPVQSLVTPSTSSMTPVQNVQAPTTATITPVVNTLQGSFSTVPSTATITPVVNTLHGSSASPFSTSSVTPVVNTITGTTSNVASSSSSSIPKISSVIPSTASVTPLVQLQTVTTQSFGTTPVVQIPGQPDLWVEVTGNVNVRFGGDATYLVLVGNKGDTDSFDTTLLLSIPSGLDFKLGTMDTPKVDGINIEGIPLSTQSGSQQIIPIWIYDIPKFSSRAFTFTVHTSPAMTQITITATAMQPADNEFFQTGKFTDVEESMIFSTFMNTYVILQNDHPGLFTMPSLEFGDKMQLWMKDHLGEFHLVPQCSLADAAFTGVLGNPVPSIVTQSLCDAIPPSIEDIFTNPGGGSVEINDTPQPPMIQIADAQVCNGQNQLCNLDTSPPLDDWDYDKLITQNFRPEVIDANGKVIDIGHDGWDIDQRNVNDPKCPPVSSFAGKPAHSMLTGIVTRSGWQEKGPSGFTFGWRVSIKTTDSEGNVHEIWYGHLLKNIPENIKVGAVVKSGDIIGFADSSGTSSGPHLHLQYHLNGKPTNPINLIAGPKNKCPTHPHNPPPYPHGQKSVGRLTSVAGHAADPNEKSGTQGFGEQRFVPSGIDLAYVISFENLPTATASAQNVVVTDQLDKNLDWNTVTIRQTSHPDVVNAKFDPNTGIITWTFTNIFLPPDTTPPQGEGWVMFSAKPKWDLPSGTEIKNKASIVFDFNAPIETNEFLNTIDSLPPKSTVNPLAPVQTSPNFGVTWSGDDGSGSGIAAYNIFVSKDGGPFSLFLSGASTSAIFNGEPGHTYGFYSVASDNAGNTELVPDTAQTTTTINLTPIQCHCDKASVIPYKTVTWGKNLIKQPIGITITGVRDTNDASRAQVTITVNWIENVDCHGDGNSCTVHYTPSIVSNNWSVGGRASTILTPTTNPAASAPSFTGTGANGLVVCTTETCASQSFPVTTTYVVNIKNAAGAGDITKNITGKVKLKLDPPDPKDCTIQDGWTIELAVNIPFSQGKFVSGSVDPVNSDYNGDGIPNSKQAKDPFIP